jgi:hypothetical protein
LQEPAARGGNEMGLRIVRCPKCTGRLYIEQDFDGRRALPPEWVCLQCGWRRNARPAELELMAGPAA